jgi:hypothetical protein
MLLARVTDIRIPFHIHAAIQHHDQYVIPVSEPPLTVKSPLRQYFPGAIVHAPLWIAIPPH